MRHAHTSPTAVFGRLLLLLAMMAAATFAPAPPLHAQDEAPAAVTIAGDFQEDLGCAADWDPACEVTALILDPATGSWQGRFELPAGSWAYKVAVDGSWDENYGAGGQADGPNIVFDVETDQEVLFAYDPVSHWSAESASGNLVVAPGTLQDELGCSGEWQPACLGAWLQDPDGDGVYFFQTTALPPGDYEGKIAVGGSWDENYGLGGEADGPNIPFTVTAAGDLLRIRFDSGDKSVAFSVIPQGAQEPPPEIAALVAEPARHPIQDALFYFVMPDRFANGDPTNDTGGIPGGRLDHGFDPTDKGFFHGGDLAGLTEKLDYLADLGVSAIWMTPVFRNNPVQGAGADVSAGYHGYWYVDMTEFDPHFGTNAELEELIDQAHARGIKVFFDIITNHTADILTYAEGSFSYRNKSDFPYLDADGEPFDDQAYAGSDDFPRLDAESSFPYTPDLPDPALADVKRPAWLNNPIYYHNRGNSSFTGESSLYGDFFGLDDLFTEHPHVVAGMLDIYSDWISNYAIDGFRVDTVKHVNLEFWQEFVPAILAHAEAEGREDFFIFGEVFSGDSALLSHYTGSGRFPAVLDFRFQEQVRNYVSGGGPSHILRDLFAGDDYFIDADSSAYMLPTFIGNHDMGRFGWFLEEDNGSLSDAEKVARSRLAHALMLTARGVPVIYYGDEQGFVGDGGDKDARQNMFPSQVASYNDDDLMGTDATTADDNFDPTHPLYTGLQELAAVVDEHPALRGGAQLHRYSSDQAGIYAFSRIDRDELVEYVVAVNNSTEEQTATFAVESAEMAFTPVYPAGAGKLSSDAHGRLTVTVPGLDLVIYRAQAARTPESAAPGIFFTTLRDGQEVELKNRELDGNLVQDRIEVGIELTDDRFAEVTFAVRPTGAAEYTVIGVDDNAPYRVFFGLDQLPEKPAEDETLEFVAVANDFSGNLSMAQVGAIRPLAVQPGQVSGPAYAVIHYLRDDGDYGDQSGADFKQFWGLHLWGDAIHPDEVTFWNEPKPFLGAHDAGRFAWVRLQDPTQPVKFIVHKGAEKDGTNTDRSFIPAEEGAEIWLRQDDDAIYTSQAAAQGYVTVRFRGDEAGSDGAWELVVTGDGLDEDVITPGTALPPEGEDEWGVSWTVPVADVDAALQVTVQPSGDGAAGERWSFTPAEVATAWLLAGDAAVYPGRGAAEQVVTIHYHRPDGDYGDPTATAFEEFWGLHVWTGAAQPNPSWQEPVRPVNADDFGLIFQVPLADDATELAYIIHRGDEKDPGPDQFLFLDRWGHQVWQLAGENPLDPNLPHYIVPTAEP